MMGARITDKGRAYVAWLKSLGNEEPTRQGAFSAGAGWAFSLSRQPLRSLLARMQTPEEAWNRYSDRVNQHIAQIQYGDPLTHADDLVQASNWEQQEAFMEAWRIMLELLAVEVQSGGLVEGEDNPAV